MPGAGSYTHASSVRKCRYDRTDGGKHLAHADRLAHGTRHQPHQRVPRCQVSDPGATGARWPLIFTGTFVGYTTAFPGIASYAASKSGLIGLTQALAVEYAQGKIRVNVILPGGTDTAMYRTMNATPEAQAFIVGLYPMRRLATPEEMANSVLYLASDLASFTTGSALLVDGGVSINRT